MRAVFGIKAKLTLWYLLIIAVLLAFSGIMAYFSLSRVLYQKTIYPWDMRLARIEMTGDGAANITSVVSLLPDRINNLPQGSIIVTHRLSEKDLSNPEGLVSIPTSQGTVDIDIAGLVPPGSEKDQDLWLRLYMSSDDPRHFDLLVIRQSTGDAALWLDFFWRTLLVISIITLAIAGIFGYFLVRRMLRPVQNITRTVREIEDTNLSRRLEVHSRDELGRLAATLNHMLERLEQAFEREKEFTADASHELRTPLTLIQGEVSLAPYEERTVEYYQQVLEAIGRQSSRMSNTIDRMMFLSSLDRTSETALDDVDLRSLLSGLVDDIQAISDPKGIALAFETEGEISLKGDSSSLRVLFLNLIENAVRYTPVGGKITIHSYLNGAHVAVSIDDTGIGIPGEHLPHIFQRFYRVDKSRSRAEGGAGLGLAICKRIAELHGGRIEVASKLGSGSTFTVYLPLSRPRS